MKKKHVRLTNEDYKGGELETKEEFNIRLFVDK